jgi:hypothetical protein
MVVGEHYFCMYLLPNFAGRIEESEYLVRMSFRACLLIL